MVTPTGTNADSLVQPDEATTAGPRRGSRVKKPTRKALGGEAGAVQKPIAGSSADQSPAETLSARRSSRSYKENRKQGSENQGKEEPSRNRGKQDGDAGQEATQQESESDEDNNTYCICRGNDDGRPMISCEDCHDWFHFDCIGLTKGAARKLKEFRCEPCKGGDGKAKENGKDDGGKSSGKSTADRRDGKAKETEGNDDGDSQSETSASEQSDTGSEHVEEGEQPSDPPSHSRARRGYARRKRRRSSHAADRSASAGADAGMDGSTDEEAEADETEVRAAARSKRARTSSTVQKSDGRRGSLSTAKAAAKSQEGARKSSLSHPSVSAGTSRAATDGEDGARESARRVLTNVIESIISTTSLEPIQSVGGTISLDLLEHFKSPQQKAAEYTKAFEEELFRLTAEGSGSTKVVGQKYRIKFRTFLFSLKDQKNQGLHLRIASGQLLAKDLAHMSKDELANETIREATEKAKQEALHRSTLLKAEVGPHRKITHKGEIEIDDDSYATRDQGGKFAKTIVTEAAEDQGGSSGTSVAAQPSPGSLSSPSKLPSRPSEAHPSGASPARATLASSSTPAPATDEAMATTNDDVEEDPSRASRSRSPSKTLLQSPTSKFDFSSVWNASDNAPSSGLNDGQEATQELGFDQEQDNVEVFQPEFLPQGEEDREGGSPYVNDKGGEADGFIDSFLGADDGPSGQEELVPSASQEEAPIREARTPDADPPSELVHRMRPIIWTGALVLPEVNQSFGVARQIVGTGIASQAWAWPYFFPTSHSLIEGRLPSKAGTEYILQVRTSTKTRMLVFTIEASSNAAGSADATSQGPADPEANVESLAKLVDHFKTLDRWGVLHRSTRARESGVVKDIYLVPLKKEDPVPVWLDLIEPDVFGEQWSQKRDRDLFLVPVVTYEGAIEQEGKRLSKSKRRSASHGGRESGNGEARNSPQHHRADPAGEAPASAEPSATASNISKNALQELLASIQRTAKAAGSPETSHTQGQEQPGSAGSTPLYSMAPPSGPLSAAPLPPGPAPRPPSFLQQPPTPVHEPSSSINEEEHRQAEAAWDAEVPVANSSTFKAKAVEWVLDPPSDPYGGYNRAAGHGGPAPTSVPSWSQGAPQGGQDYYSEDPYHSRDGRNPGFHPPDQAQRGYGSPHYGDGFHAQAGPPPNAYSRPAWQGPGGPGGGFQPHGEQNRSAPQGYGDRPPQHEYGAARGGRERGHGWGRGRGRY